MSFDMERKNIFEIANDNFNFHYEILKLNSLISKQPCIQIRKKDIYISDGTPFLNCTLRDFVDSYSFKYWSNRGTYLNLNEWEKSIGIPNILIKMKAESTPLDWIIYLEYVSNLLHLVTCSHLNENYYVVTWVEYRNIKENVQILLDRLNCEAQYFEDKDCVLVVEKNAAAGSVAEIVGEDIAPKVIEYNHYLLKGNLPSKEAILLTLGKELEANRAKLKNIAPQLESDIFYMLNNFDLRHNNHTEADHKYHEYVAKMDSEQKEHWYDELYQLILLANLELDNIGRSERVHALKQAINGGTPSGQT